MTSKTFSLLTAAAALASAFIMSGARAQAPAAGASPSFWGLGLGVGFEKKPYRDFDDKAQALPLLMYENRHVSFLGTRVDLKLPSAGPVSFRLRLRYAGGDGYEADDSPALQGMEDRDAGIWLGGVATWRNPVANLSLEAAADASGNSKGRLVKLGLEHGFKAGAFEFTPRLAATWFDKKYVGYYYGVNADEARPGRAFYEGRGTVNAELGLRVNYALAPQQGVFLDLGATRFGSAIQDSPLVDKSSQSSVRLGYLYRF